MTQAQAFLWTLALEAPCAAALAAAFRWAPGRVAAVALAAVVGSAVTHPLLWAADAALRDALARGPRWALLEAGVVAVETAAYAVVARLPGRRSLALSIAANAFSFGVGLALAAAGA